MGDDDKSTKELRKSAGTNRRKNFLALKDSASEGSSAITLNATALGSVTAEALKSSFERRFHWPGRLDCLES